MSGTWLDFLQPASWRGVPFSVLNSEVRAGRRTALHEYPNRDVPWVEDLGLATGYFSFQGFLVGDDCYIQEKSMIAAANTPGPGTLVHPSLGLISVSCMGFTSRQSMERGRAVLLEFTFAAGEPAQLFPSIIADTIGQVESWANSALGSIGIDFATDIAAPIAQGAQLLQQGAAVAQGAFTAVQAFGATADRLVGDASLVSGAMSGIPGDFGRYAGGNLTGLQRAGVTIQSALSGVTTARTVVNDAATEAGTLANLL